METLGAMTRAYVKNNRQRLHQENLQATSGFRFEDDRLLAIKHKIFSSNIVRLGEITKVTSGVATGDDKAFEIDKDFAMLLLKQDKYHNIIKPCIRGEHCTEDVTTTDRYIIVFPKGFTDRHVGFFEPLDYMRNNYPEVMTHLDHLVKDQNKKGYWWEVAHEGEGVATHAIQKISRNFKICTIKLEGAVAQSSCTLLSIQETVKDILNMPLMGMIYNMFLATNSIRIWIYKSPLQVAQLPLPKELLNQRNITQQQLAEAFNLTPHDVDYLASCQLQEG